MKALEDDRVLFALLDNLVQNRKEAVEASDLSTAYDEAGSDAKDNPGAAAFRDATMKRVAIEGVIRSLAHADGLEPNEAVELVGDLADSIYNLVFPERTLRS